MTFSTCKSPYTATKVEYERWIHLFSQITAIFKRIPLQLTKSLEINDFDMHTF